MPLMRWNAPTLGPKAFKNYKGVGPRTVAPSSVAFVRPGITKYQVDVGTATVVATMPDCYPGDLIVATFSCSTSSSFSSTAGLAFSNPISNGVTGSAIILLSRRAGTSSSGAKSDDAGQTTTFTNTSTLQCWTLTVFVVANAHLTYATALNATQFSSAAAGSSSATMTGTTPTVPGTCQVTCVSYGSDATVVYNDFNPTSGVDGDYLLTTNPKKSVSARGRSLGIWVNTYSPQVGVAAASRTVSVYGGELGAFAGYSLTFAPQTGVAGDAFWNVPSMRYQPNATYNVMDVILPSSGTAPPGGWPWVLYVHGGGVSGDKALVSGTHDATLALLGSPYNCAVVAVNYRIANIACDAGDTTGIEIGMDMKSVVRYMRGKACGMYNLNPNRVVGFGTSAGGSILSASIMTPDHPIISDNSTGDADQSEVLDAVLIWYSSSNMAAEDTQFSALGIVPIGIPVESPGSTEERLLVGAAHTAYGGSWQGVKNEPRFDATAWPLTGSPVQTTDLNRYNVMNAQYWASGRDTCGTRKPAVRTSHGTLDDRVPYLQTWNDGTGVGATTPSGLYQKLTAAGWNVSCTLVAGADHGQDSMWWKPSTRVGNLNGLMVDQDLAWIANMAKQSGTSFFLSRRSRLMAAVEYFKNVGMHGMIPPGWE